ncbi:MAG TPA: PP2C family protein-serine/threonine phosphatase, partial [Clostridia bacterium]|nr:PP2C family protein-serine/threonine phosphatase [Clostridia bacterium]
TVGGDFFTISALSETQVGVFLCDVAGHGVRSALVTAMVRALVEELKSLASSPGEFLSKLNGDLCEILKHTGTPLLTTAFCLVADWQNGAMRYANAGHPRPLHVRRSAGQVVPLVNASGKSQPALGLLEGTQYQSSEIILTPGDLVLLFTDGLIEVQDQKGDLYTQQMLLSAVGKRLQTPTSCLFDELLNEIKEFSEGTGFTDDVCMVGVDLAR